MRLLRTRVVSKFAKMFGVLRIVRPNHDLLVFVVVVVALHSVCSALPRPLCGQSQRRFRVDAVHCSRGHRAMVVFAVSSWLADCHALGNSAVDSCHHTAIGVC